MMARTVSIYTNKYNFAFSGTAGSDTGKMNAGNFLSDQNLFSPKS